MPDDPDRKKSLREQVEEYKRRQEQAGERERKTREAGHDDVSHDASNDDDLDEDDEAFDAGFENAGVAARASGANVVRIVSAVFLTVGLVLLLVSATIFWFTRRSVAAEVSAPGVVVRSVVRSHTMTASGSSRATTSDYYHAVVEFTLADGTKKTVEMSEGSWPKAYEEGEAVTVRYDPHKPLTARLGGGGAMDFFASLLTGFLGAVFTAVAIGVRRAFA